MINLDFGVVRDSLPYLWQGMKYTLQLTATSAIGGLFFGTLLAMARLSSMKPLAWFASAYVNLCVHVRCVLVIFLFSSSSAIAQAIIGAERPCRSAPSGRPTSRSSCSEPRTSARS